MSLAAQAERFFHGPQAAVRPYLLLRILPALLALDIWMLMIGHAGRYGAAGFNVAHFPLLDRLLPTPSPASYIGLLILTGLLSLHASLAGLSRWGGAALCTLYTLSWSISMLDSYQHHYFLSLVLVCLAAFPTVTARDIMAEGGRARSTGFGYPLLACTIAILYVFAAIAKWDARWLAGDTIRRISEAERLLAPWLERAATAGVANDAVWQWVSTAVIPMEIALGLGYLVAAQQDRIERRPIRLLCALTACLAFCLHVGAEAMALDIGWFSYYMMVLAIVFLLPAAWLSPVAKLWARPGCWLRAQLDEVQVELDGEPSGRAIGFLVAAGAAGMSWYAGRQVDLPGAEPVCAIAGGALVIVSLGRIIDGRPGALVRPSLSLAAAALLMWAAIAQSEVRWDFYRFLGGDLARRGELAEALETYLTGEAYAPEGETRQPKIERLKRQLAR